MPRIKRKPLSGKTLVLTRPRDPADGLAAKLRKLGAEVFLFPVIRTAPPPSYKKLDSAIRELKNAASNPYDWILFTSQNGVRHFAKRMKGRLPPSIRTCAIGPQTARVMRACGLPVHRTAGTFRAEAMVPLLGKIRGCRILLPRTRQARETLPALLKKRGARVDVVETYRTLPEARPGKETRRQILRGKADCITFTSPSTATYFTRHFSKEEIRKIFKKTKAASIGPITSQSLRKHGIPSILQAQSYDSLGLVRKIAEFFCKKKCSLQKKRS